MSDQRTNADVAKISTVLVLVDCTTSAELLPGNVFCGKRDQVLDPPDPGIKGDAKATGRSSGIFNAATAVHRQEQDSCQMLPMPVARNGSLKLCVHLINLLRYRNRNQHRRSVWWRWMSILSKSVNRLHNCTKADDPDVFLRVARHLDLRIVPKAFMYVHLVGT